ncbi:MAG: hypothetical protein WA962_11965 [Ornithinimicrobium sp.]
MPTLPKITQRVVVLTSAFSVAVLAGCAGQETAEDGSGLDTAPSRSIGQGDANRQESSGAEADPEANAEQLFPDIVDVAVTRVDGHTASFAVTVSSPYDSPQRYADGWRVLDQDGEVLGEHTLGHDHASEQPFTRTQSDVMIPSGTTELTIEGRDQVSGYGGDTVTVQW